jgi:hypothetical protein
MASAMGFGFNVAECSRIVGNNYRITESVLEEGNMFFLHISIASVKSLNPEDRGREVRKKSRKVMEVIIWGGGALQVSQASPVHHSDEQSGSEDVRTVRTVRTVRSSGLRQRPRNFDFPELMPN